MCLKILFTKLLRIAIALVDVRGVTFLAVFLVATVDFGLGSGGGQHSASSGCAPTDENSDAAPPHFAKQPRRLRHCKTHELHLDPASPWIELI